MNTIIVQWGLREKGLSPRFLDDFGCINGVRVVLCRFSTRRFLRLNLYLFGLGNLLLGGLEVLIETNASVESSFGESLRRLLNPIDMISRDIAATYLRRSAS